MTLLKNKIIKTGLFMALMSAIGWLFIHKTPEQLAGDTKYIPQFFGLTESDFTAQSGNVMVIDELHSQGRKFEDFGSAHYEIQLCELHPNVRREIKEKGGIRTDSTWVLTRDRGHIRGVLIVKHNSSKAFVHYNQLYSE